MWYIFNKAGLSEEISPRSIALVRYACQFGDRPHRELSIRSSGTVSRAGMLLAGAIALK